MLEFKFSVIKGILRRSDGYQLFSSLKRIGLCHNGEPGLQILGSGKVLLIRSEDTRFAGLANANLTVDGMAVKLGHADVSPIKPNYRLASWCVTIKGKTADACLRMAVFDQLKNIGVKSSIRVANRQIVHVAGSKIVGYTVSLSDLSEIDSVAVQMHGIGGRNRFGCGVFIPC